jgi:hypothetical protein
VSPPARPAPAAVEHVGAWDAPVQLRWTTKFDDVAGFVSLAHHGRTRVRSSVNCRPVTDRVEGGTSRLGDRLATAGISVGSSLLSTCATLHGVVK